VNQQLEYYETLPNVDQSLMRLRPRPLPNDPKSHAYFSVVIGKWNKAKTKLIEKIVSDFEHNAVPSVFIDKLHKMVFQDLTAAERGFGSIGLTADTTQTLDATVTALTGEITTNGLQRVDATSRTHTAGTNVTVVSHTFTLSGTQSDITRAALFNINTAPVSGTIGPVAAFTNGATGSMSSGETVNVAITITTS
jgi:hypothetical protein